MTAQVRFHEQTIEGILISDDPARFDVIRAHGWIAGESYWGQGIPLQVFRRALAESLTVGAYLDTGEMGAMARVVTDRATFGWVCDVFVDSSRRGLGLSKRLVAYLKSHPDLQGLRRLHLATRDAHGLYAKFGFGPLTGPENWMEIRDPHPYRRQPSPTDG